jgi:hypothetical protein
MGRTLAITLLPAALLLSAAGCTQNSVGEFHTYHPTNKVADQPAEPSAKGSAAAGKSTDESPESQSSRPGATPQQPQPSQLPLGGGSSPSASGQVGATKADAPAVQASIPASSNPIAAAKGPQPAASTAPRTVKVLVPTKSFRNEGGAGGPLRVSYDDIDLLKVLNMDPVPANAATYFPDWLKALDGQRIRIRGFMYPTFQQTGVHVFGLARDNQICCFGRNPKIYDVFDVVLREGTTTNYIPNRPFDVVGVFHIRPESEGGKLYRLYEMDDAAVFAK